MLRALWHRTLHLSDQVLASNPDSTCVMWLLQMGLQGPLGQLQRGVSDVVSEVEVINEDDARQRWTATSAELWPVRLCGVMRPVAAKFLQSEY